MILNLFPHLKGHSVLHGSPGYENKEIIENVRTDRINKDAFITLEFQSGAFTYISKKDFDQYLEEGRVSFQRQGGFTAMENLLDLSTNNL